MRCRVSRVRPFGGRLVLFLAFALPLAADDPPLFPTPLHLVRRVEDPISGTTSVVDEYCAANRIVTVDGYRTVIVDYGRRELLQIDRATSTYSIARFDEIAAANRVTEPRSASATRDAWKTTPRAAKPSPAGHASESFEITGTAPDAITIELTVDRQVSVSRQAFDALTGAAYPNHASGQQAAIARAAQRSTDVAAARSSDAYGLPLEQAITFETGGRRLTVRNSIVSVTNDLPPPELLAIPSGAKLVPSRAASFLKATKELKDTVSPHP